LKRCQNVLNENAVVKCSKEALEVIRENAIKLPIISFLLYNLYNSIYLASISVANNIVVNVIQ
jgi:hypothetical protein